MAKPKKKAAKLRPDVAETAFRVMQEAIGEAPRTAPPGERPAKNEEAVKRGRKGGKKGGAKGGRVRAQRLSPNEREEAAQTAALARWKRT